MRVRLALKRMRLKIPLKNIHERKEYLDELVAGGGKKQVPCLRIESSTGQTQWLYESTDIIRYIRRKAARI